jgi:hypothetical protein
MQHQADAMTQTLYLHAQPRTHAQPHAHATRPLGCSVAYTPLMQHQADAMTQTLYLVVTTLIMGLELLTVVNATLCAILGPGLALRGPDGSMHTAVNGMMTHYKFTLMCFATGLICFMLSALLYGWMQFPWTLALPMTILICYFLYKIFTYFIRIYRRFRLAPDHVVTGAFNADGASDGPRSAAEMAEERELQAQYANLPESVKASMGVAGPSAR